MGIIKTIYIVSVLLSLFLFVCACAKSIYVIRERYPSFKFPHMHWADKVVTVIKVICIVIIPVFNSFVAALFIFEFDELCYKAIRTIEEKYNLK